MSAGRRSAIWSPEALTDLDQLWDYYAEVAGLATADKLVRQMAEKVGLVESYPHAGRLRDELRPGIRSIAASPHVVFYRLKDETPEIVRVLDGRRDIDEIFGDDRDRP